MDSSELTHPDDVQEPDDAQEFVTEVIELVLPAGAGYTIRAHPAAETAGGGEPMFLTQDRHLLLFSDPDQLAAFLADEDDHDLARLPGWSQRAAAAVALAFADAPESAGNHPTDEVAPAGGRYEFDLVPTNLGGSPDQWIPELLLPARDLTVELARALDLKRIRAALAEGEYLDRFDDALRAAAAAGTFSLARRRLRGFESARLAGQWRQLIRWLEQAVRWRD